MMLRKVFMILMLLLIGFGLSAQIIKGEIDGKDGKYEGYVSYESEKGQTYSIELWVAPAGSSDYVLATGLTDKFGPGLPESNYIKFTFKSEQLPQGISGKISYRFKLVPDVPKENWSSIGMVYIESPAEAAQVNAANAASAEVEGFSGDWFNTSLVNNRYYAFGITGVSNVNGRFALDFTITNTQNDYLELSWDRDRAVMMRFINVNGGEQIIYTGDFRFAGVSRGQYGHYEIPANASINGQIVLGMSYRLVDHVTMGTCGLNLLRRGVRESIRFGRID